jgi:glycosyltransferase involved in cell wall biosynthesis
VYDSIVNRTLRYCDYYTPTCEVKHEWNTANEYDWLHTFKKDANIHIAQTCDGIISGLYEYDVAYRPHFPEKTTFIPFPIDIIRNNIPKVAEPNGKIRFFIGIQRQRSVLKGTDIMLRALERVIANYPDKAEMVKAESVPFSQYKEMMHSSDVLLDQIYSYTPAMNALLAMSQGLIVVSGGEPESYDILDEKDLRPIINVQPDEEDIYRQLEELVLHPERIAQLKRDSIAYIERHHDSIKVAQRYIEAWSKTH